MPDKQPPKQTKTRFGIEGLDDVLRGGLVPNRLYLIQGDPCVGKTTLALQYLLEGLRNGERVLYVTLSETTEELVEVAASHGWTLDGIDLYELSAAEERERTNEEQSIFDPAEVDLNETMAALLERVERVNPTRVVFDSLSEIRLLAQSALRYRRQILSMKQFFAGRSTTVLLLDDRTGDVGGDKQLPYLDGGDAREENPAMGWRALRLALDRGALMKAQARALIEAAAGRDLDIMFPMVSEPWEFDEARALVEAQRLWLAERRKMVPRAVRYGCMLEVPALAETLDMLLPRLDFVSIGTNDLTQFLFAADRSNPRLAERYDWLSPAILRFLKRVVAQCDAAGVSVGVCGEMGGRTLEALALIGIGLKRLSITPAAVGPVKAMIRSLDRGAAMAELDRLLAAPPRNLRAALADFAARHDIAIG